MVATSVCVICAIVSILCTTYRVRRIDRLITVSNGVQPQLPYRSAEITAEILQPHDGSPLKTCPACGAQPVVCSGCSVSRTDRNEGQMHAWFCTSSCYHNPSRPLTFTHATSETNLCSPNKRRRGCMTPGIHVHQTCERCGWTGVAHIFAS